MCNKFAQTNYKYKRIFFFLCFNTTAKCANPWCITFDDDDHLSFALNTYEYRVHVYALFQNMREHLWLATTTGNYPHIIRFVVDFCAYIRRWGFSSSSSVADGAILYSLDANLNRFASVKTPIAPLIIASYEIVLVHKNLLYQTSKLSIILLTQTRIDSRY